MIALPNAKSQALTGGGGGGGALYTGLRSAAFAALAAMANATAVETINFLIVSPFLCRDWTDPRLPALRHPNDGIPKFRLTQNQRDCVVVPLLIMTCGHDDKVKARASA